MEPKRQEQVPLRTRKLPHVTRMCRKYSNKTKTSVLNALTLETKKGIRVGCLDLDLIMFIVDTYRLSVPS